MNAHAYITTIKENYNGLIDIEGFIFLRRKLVISKGRMSCFFLKNTWTNEQEKERSWDKTTKAEQLKAKTKPELKPRQPLCFQ